MWFKRKDKEKIKYETGHETGYETGFAGDYTNLMPGSPLTRSEITSLRALLKVLEKGADEFQQSKR